MPKNTAKSDQFERFLALIESGRDVTVAATRLEKAGAAAAHTRIDRLRDWLIQECEGQQAGAYRELAKRLKKRRKAASRKRVTN